MVTRFDCSSELLFINMSLSCSRPPCKAFTPPSLRIPALFSFMRGASAQQARIKQNRESKNFSRYACNLCRMETSLEVANPVSTVHKLYLLGTQTVGHLKNLFHISTRHLCTSVEVLLRKASIFSSKQCVLEVN